MDLRKYSEKCSNARLFPGYKSKMFHTAHFSQPYSAIREEMIKKNMLPLAISCYTEHYNFQAKKENSDPS